MKLSTVDLTFIKFVQDGVPKQLSVLRIETRLDICQQNLDQFDKEGDAFLDRIITGDKTWVHHYEPECKWQSMDWKLPKSPIRKKFESEPSAGKLMLTVFLDPQGPILDHYQENGLTINSARYSELLVDRMKPEIQSKLPRRTVERHCVVVRQCLSAYCCPHGCNHPETQV